MKDASSVWLNRFSTLFLSLLVVGTCTGSRIHAQTTSTLLPTSYTTTQGADGGQPVANLGTMNESGLANDWNNYVEFEAEYASTPYIGYTSYTLPTSITPSEVTGIQLQANYLGPNTSTQIWTWQIYDWVHSAYVTLGDNTFATGWGSWKVLNFNAWGNLSNYVRATDGRIQIQLSSNNDADNVNIDYQAVVVTSNSSNPSSNNSYYVSTSSGSDTNSGTYAAPWKTIQHAANNVGAGSTVYVEGGTYYEQVTIGVNGSSSGGYIHFQSYPGQTAILDGTGVTIPYSTDSASRGLIQITGKSYVTIEGFEIRNIAPDTSSVFPAGISVIGNSNNIQIRGNKIHDINNGIYGAHAIGVYGNGTSSLNNITIDGNQLYNLTLGYSESMHIDGDVQYFTVSNNQVHDTNNIGIDALGFYGTSSVDDQARNGSIIGNLVYNASGATNPAYGSSGSSSAAGIYVDGGTQIVIADNISHDNDIGIQVTSEHANKVASYVYVQDNVIWHNNESGISLGGYSTSVGSTDHTYVVNNSLFQNDSKQDGIGELNLQYFAAGVSGNVFENNIIYTNSQGSIVTSWINTPIISMDYNLYYPPSGVGSYSWVWNSAGKGSLAAWRTATGGEAHSQVANPDYDETTYLPPDLFPTSSSPAISAGYNLGSTYTGTTDFNGHPRVASTIDIGAYEQ